MNKKQNNLIIRGSIVAIALSVVFTGKAAYDLHNAMADMDKELNDIHCTTLELNEIIAKNYPDIAAKNDIKSPTAEQKATCPDFNAGPR